MFASSFLYISPISLFTLISRIWSVAIEVQSFLQVKVILQCNSSTATLPWKPAAGREEQQARRIREVDLGRNIVRKGSFEVLVSLHQQETNMRLELILGEE